MNIRKFFPYFSNLILIWLAILIYLNLPYYSGFIRHETKTALLILAAGYTLFGLIFYLASKDPKESKGLLVIGYAAKLFKDLKHKKLTKTLPEEKNAILFTAVKFFFLPIMLNFFFSNFSAFKNQAANISFSSVFSIIGFNNFVFPLALTLVFMLDTLIFAFGYAFESSSLKNKIRSVEPTILGWVVALACYPPFNDLVSSFLGWSADDYFNFTSLTATFFLRLGILFFLAVYLSATFALGTKSSNLTNRGIVKRFPYSIIRHPAYISKNLAWWLTVIPLGSLTAVLSMAGWSLIYHLRTITEERHLSLDSEYKEYKNKVKYRYIPGIY